MVGGYMEHTAKGRRLWKEIDKLCSESDTKLKEAERIRKIIMTKKKTEEWEDDGKT